MRSKIKSEKFMHFLVCIGNNLKLCIYAANEYSNTGVHKRIQ